MPNTTHPAPVARPTKLAIFTERLRREVEAKPELRAHYTIAAEPNPLDAFRIDALLTR